eukprot:snap_masked-scaffold_42-processed-gene-0.28-mRNA-1 protein AED:1.00 eAED:1.00 QI:0/0/0/0/1/1/3/0/80
MGYTPLKNLYLARLGPITNPNVSCVCSFIQVSSGALSYASLRDVYIFLISNFLVNVETRSKCETFQALKILFIEFIIGDK